MAYKLPRKQEKEIVDKLITQRASWEGWYLYSEYTLAKGNCPVKIQFIGPTKLRYGDDDIDLRFLSRIRIKLHFDPLYKSLKRLKARRMARDIIKAL